MFWKFNDFIIKDERDKSLPRCFFSYTIKKWWMAIFISHIYGLRKILLDITALDVSIHYSTLKVAFPWMFDYYIDHFRNDYEDELNN